jgi:hypothetical protein
MRSREGGDIGEGEEERRETERVSSVDLDGQEH